ncbi:MAG: hypothetical protein ACE5R4_11600 [Armatimonadota bacterium]
MTKRMPLSVAIAGYLCMGLGVFAALCSGGAFLVTTLVPELRHPFAGGAQPLEFVGAHYRTLAATEFVLAIPFAAAGLALANGREWGRRVVVAILGLAMPFMLLFGCGMSAGVLSAPRVTYQDMVAEGTSPVGAALLTGTQPYFIATSWTLSAKLMVMLYFAIHWLRSPAVMEACRGTGATTADGET